MRLERGRRILALKEPFAVIWTKEWVFLDYHFDIDETTHSYQYYMYREDTGDFLLSGKVSYN